MGLRKISYSEPSWEKWQEMFHKSTASGDSSYNTAYRDVMRKCFPMSIMTARVEAGICQT